MKSAPSELDKKFLRRYVDVCTPEELKLQQSRARVTQLRNQQLLAKTVHEQLKAKTTIGLLQGNNLNLAKAKSVAIQNQSISSKQSSGIEGLFVQSTKKISTKAKPSRKVGNRSHSSASIPVS